MPDADLCFTSARDLADRLRRRDLSAREVLHAHLDQIERVNPHVNAIVTLIAEQAMDAAGAADDAAAAGEPLGVLHGLPLAVKDMVPTKGVRTTLGTTLLADNVPDVDGLIVEREKAAGAVIVGKTNVPELGAGSHTFNPVFGVTRNPYDLTRTCGGSSGGAAVALACGMVPLADGSDLGGSLRNPASFCNVVGFRPSPGRVPTWPSQLAWQPFTVEGPMAREVGDVAFFLSAIAGPDPRSPIAIEQDGARFRSPLDRDVTGTRVAWATLGLPYEPAVLEVVDAQQQVFEALGCHVEAAEPDVAGADDIFHVWRAWIMEAQYGAWASRPATRAQLKDTVQWNVDLGTTLTGPQVAKAEMRRTALRERFRRFFEVYDFLLLPVTQVLPFPVEVEWVTEIDGEPMTTYIDWMRSCSWISVTGHPAISVPAGFAGDLPVGIQIVGRHHDDWGVLQLAHAFEQATLTGRRRPPVAMAS